MIRNILIAFALFTIALARFSEDVYQSEWDAFKTKFEKMYTSEEENNRYTIFKENYDAAFSKNASDPTATYGVTKFSDLTSEEFRSQFLMTQLPETNEPARRAMDIAEPQALPTSFDWRSKNMVTPVKNQGQCGSCWDFSATETIESVCAIAGFPLTKLSEQQILDCDTTDYGCDGGWPYNAMEYVIKAGGMETEADYPYTAADGSCSANKADFTKCKPISWKYVTQSKSETTMQNFLYNNSPMSVCVDAASWQFYTGGVISQSSNCGTSIDHCVQVTGYSQQSNTPVWNVRNSWGADWGISGYLYVERGYDVCAIAEVVTVPCVTGTDGKTYC